MSRTFLASCGYEGQAAGGGGCALAAVLVFLFLFVLRGDHGWDLLRPGFPGSVWSDAEHEVLYGEGFGCAVGFLRQLHGLRGLLESPGGLGGGGVAAAAWRRGQFLLAEDGLGVLRVRLLVVCIFGVRLPLEEEPADISSGLRLRLGGFVGAAEDGAGGGDDVVRRGADLVPCLECIANGAKVGLLFVRRGGLAQGARVRVNGMWCFRVVMDDGGGGRREIRECAEDEENLVVVLGALGVLALRVRLEVCASVRRVDGGSHVLLAHHVVLQGSLEQEDHEIASIRRQERPQVLADLRVPRARAVRHGGGVHGPLQVLDVLEPHGELHVVAHLAAQAVQIVIKVGCGVCLWSLLPALLLQDELAQGVEVAHARGLLHVAFFILLLGLGRWRGAQVGMLFQVGVQSWFAWMEARPCLRLVLFCVATKDGAQHLWARRVKIGVHLHAPRLEGVFLVGQLASKLRLQCPPHGLGRHIGIIFVQGHPLSQSALQRCIVRCLPGQHH